MVFQAIKKFVESLKSCLCYAKINFNTGGIDAIAGVHMSLGDVGMALKVPRLMKCFHHLGLSRVAELS